MPACVPLPSTSPRLALSSNLCELPELHTSLCAAATFPSSVLLTHRPASRAPLLANSMLPLNATHRTCRRASPRFPVLWVALREPHIQPHMDVACHVAATRPRGLLLPHTLARSRHQCELALARNACSRMRNVPHCTAMHRPTLCSVHAARSVLALHGRDLPPLARANLSCWPSASTQPPLAYSMPLAPPLLFDRVDRTPHINALDIQCPHPIPRCEKREASLYLFGR